MLLTKELTVKSIKSKTTAKGFTGLEVGDKVVIEFNIHTHYYSRHRVAIRNVKTGDEVEKTVNQLTNILASFEWEEQ